jgi:hypothetical protein
MLKVLISLTSAIIIFGTTTSICGRITVRTFSSRKWTETGTARSRERSFSRMQAAPPKGLTRSALSIVSTETTIVV